MQTVGIESVVVNVRVLVPLALAGLSKITVVELEIEAIVTVSEMPFL